MNIKLFLFIVIILFPVISVRSQDITTPDLNLINVYTIPEKELKSVSNISLDSDYTLFICLNPYSIESEVELVREYYDYLNHSQIEIFFVFLTRIESYNDIIFNINHYNISNPVCVTETSTSFDHWRRGGLYVILFDQINREVVKTYRSLSSITMDEILLEMNLLGITFVDLPRELSKSIYKSNKTNGFELLIFIPIIIIIWRKRSNV